jgi:hypothetical protein
VKSLVDLSPCEYEEIEPFMLRMNIQVLGDCNIQRNTQRRPTIILRRAALIFLRDVTAKVYRPPRILAERVELTR